RQAPGSGKLADGARDALGHGVVVGAENDHACQAARIAGPRPRPRAVPSALPPLAGAGGIAARRLALDAQLLGYEKQRAPLYLLVHAPQILADHAERDELHASEE